jgi:hypothetical protein
LDSELAELLSTLKQVNLRELETMLQIQSCPQLLVQSTLVKISSVTRYMVPQWKVGMQSQTEEMFSVATQLPLLQEHQHLLAKHQLRQAFLNLERKLRRL